MKCFSVPLPSDSGSTPELRCYIPDNFASLEADRKRTAVLICPGGAYVKCCDYEAEMVALQYVAEDMAAFVLYYSAKDHQATFPKCQLEALTSIKLIRENCEEWHIDPERIAILGFSAGGHLAGSVGALWNADFAKEAFGDCSVCKPNAVILCYAVLTSDNRFWNKGSFHHLMGRELPQGVYDSVSVEKLVTEEYPPTFLWHTAEDTTVPPQNSMLMAMALAEKGVRYELHIYPEGKHGTALANEKTAPVRDGVASPAHLVPRASEWMGNSIRFLKNNAFKS